MTKETRIGLLVGMGMIIFICILVSDMMSGEPADAPADLRRDRDAADAQGSANEPPLGRLADLRPARAQPNAGDADGGTDRGDDVAEHDRSEQRSVDRSLSQTGEFQPDDLVLTSEPREGDDNAAPDRNGFIFHHVQPGESPWSIAEKYYGDGQYYELIYEHNRERMPAADVVRKGVTLRIPKRHNARPPESTDASDARSSSDEDDRGGASRDDEPRATSDESAAEPPTTTVEHTIAEGETMLELAQQYYGTVQGLSKLMALNEDRIDDPDRVRVGQKIRVPADPRR